MGYFLIESKISPPRQEAVDSTGVPYTILVLPFPRKDDDDPNYIVAFMSEGKNEGTMFFFYATVEALEEVEEYIERSGKTQFETYYGMYLKDELFKKEMG